MTANLAPIILTCLFLWGKKKEEDDKEKKPQLKVPSKMGSRYAAAPSHFQDPATKDGGGGVFSDFVKDSIITGDYSDKNEKPPTETVQSYAPAQEKTQSYSDTKSGDAQSYATPTVPTNTQPAQPQPTTPSSPAQTLPAPQKELKKLSKKMVMLGDGGCGKSSLIKKYVYSTFDDKYIHTIGVHITKKEVPYPEEGVVIVLNIWDIQGQKNLVNYESNATGALGAFIVCDVTRNQTLEHMPEWIDMMKRKAPNGKMILIANKWDLKDRAEFGEFQMKYLASKNNCLWFPTSAKTGENVERAFKAIADQILDMHKKGS